VYVYRCADSTYKTYLSDIESFVFMTSHPISVSASSGAIVSSIRCCSGIVLTLLVTHIIGQKLSEKYVTSEYQELQTKHSLQISLISLTSIDMTRMSRNYMKTYQVHDT
jgi:hypothetical protein